MDRLVAEINYDIDDQGKEPLGAYLVIEPGFNFLTAEWVKITVEEIDPVEIEVVEYA